MECLKATFVAFVFVKITINVIGLAGNSLCLMVFFQKQMKSSYNYLLMGLTISDAMCLIMSLLWCLENLELINLNSNNFSLDELDSVQGFVFIWDWICTGGTKYFTVAVSLERFIVVCYPLRAREWVTTKRSKIFALSVFTFVIALALFSFTYNYYIDSESFEIFAAIVLHFSPFAAVMIINVFTFIAFRRFKKHRKMLTESEAADVSVTRMLLAVVGVFGFCYSFEFTRRVMNYVGYFDYTTYSYHDYMICRLADTFYAVNSSVNFIIYYLLGTKFRTQFIRLVKKCTLSA